MGSSFRALQHTGLATGAITLGEVTALDHEVLDNAVEGRSLVAEALLASGESAEVLSGLGNRLAVKAHGNTTKVLITVLEVEVDLVGDLGATLSLSRLGEEDRHNSEEKGGVDEDLLDVEHIERIDEIRNGADLISIDKEQR